MRLICSELNLLALQDTIKAEPSELCKNPETKQMKRAISGAVLVTTAFYMTVGCLGYSAFGDVAPVNVLIVEGSQHGFVNPSWLVDTANVLVMINMLGGYQVRSAANSPSNWPFCYTPPACYAALNYYICSMKSTRCRHSMNLVAAVHAAA